MNIEKLASTLLQGEAYLITSAENCFYFTGFQNGEGVLLITPKERVYMTDGRYIEAAQAAITCCTEILDAPVFTDEIERICSFEGVKTLYVETGRITLGFFEKLRSSLEERTVAGTDRLENEINALRSVKAAQEIERIRKAQTIAEKGFDFILTRIKPGVSEIEIARELDFFMLRNGAQAVSFDTIAVTGAKTSMPHGVPGNEIIKKGDFFLLDFGAVYEGYHSDMTRTVAVGEISGRQAEIYNIVLEAQRRSLDFLAPGRLCRD
ncbi:MAG: aminopeptidase P family protein, partial [Clostridia bacterium]|nr:aminopeptidase P family protein [Clostridia bacterium]